MELIALGVAVFLAWGLLRTGQTGVAKVTHQPYDPKLEHDSTIAWVGAIILALILLGAAAYAGTLGTVFDNTLGKAGTEIWETRPEMLR